MSRFHPGQSGNPAGRPKGKPLKSTELRKAIELRADEILQSVINAAVQGDMTACKMLLDRIIPTLKAYAMPINIPKQNSLTGQADEIVTAVMSGQIPPDIASQLLSALAHQLRIVEIDELSKRVEALEIVR